MLVNGDVVIYSLDGSRGIVLGEKGRCYQIMWEDYFVSWEPINLLTKDEELTKKQHMILS